MGQKNGEADKPNIEDILAEMKKLDQTLDEELKALGMPDLDAILDPDGFDPFKGYPPLVKTSYEADDDKLMPELEKLLHSGADPNEASPYGETAIAQLFMRGRMDGFRLLLDHGVTVDGFEWSELHQAVVLGDLDKVKALATGADLATRDSTYRTPYLLACRLGEVEKAAHLRPLTSDDGLISSEEEESALHIAARGGHVQMLEWLLAQGDDINATDEFGGTALLVAVEYAKPAAVKTLLKAGADPELGQNLSASLRKSQTQPEGAFAKAAALISGSVKKALKLDAMEGMADFYNTPASSAYDPEIARLLVNAGVGPEQFDADMMPDLTGASLITPQNITPEMFQKFNGREFGSSNPQTCDNPFYLEQIRSGESGFLARSAIMGDQDEIYDGAPVWSFSRFGRSATLLPDGRWVLIAGEHEDHYDPDFCIYNDVTVLDGKGGVEHNIYPRDVFPPTDFHSATLVEDCIWLIGNLGYAEDRPEGVTQVLRLSLKDFSVEKITTTGENPGWINRHAASLNGRAIKVSGGKLEPSYRDLEASYALDLDSLIWKRLNA